MIYSHIKFEAPKPENFIQRDGKVKRAALKVLSLIIPAANPDFEKKIDNVKEWLVEYDMEGNFTNREVGIDNLGRPIVIFPWKKNYGYWIDIDMKLENYFSQLNAKNITQEEFDTYWKMFEDEQ